MFVFFKMLSQRLRKTTVNFLRNYIKTKHGEYGDVCAIWKHEGYIFWETSTTGGVLSADKKIETLVRLMVSQSILYKSGPAIEPEKIPYVYLVVFPSVGIKRMFSIIKHWAGRSVAMGYEVVRYKLFCRRG